MKFRHLAPVALALASLTALAAPAFADTQTAAAQAHTIAYVAYSQHQIVTNKIITENTDGIMQVPVYLMGTIPGHPREVALQMAWYVDLACITFPAKIGAAPIVITCPASIKLPASMATVVADHVLATANAALNGKSPVTLSSIRAQIPHYTYASIHMSAVAGKHARDVLFTLSSDSVRSAHVCINIPTDYQTASSVNLVGPNGSGSC